MRILYYNSKSKVQRRVKENFSRQWSERATIAKVRQVTEIVLQSKLTTLPLLGFIRIKLNNVIKDVHKSVIVKHR